MRDVQEVAEVVEETLRLPMECLVESARAVADRKASMLLDAENDKPVEAEGVVGPVVEIAKLTVCISQGITNIAQLISPRWQALKDPDCGLQASYSYRVPTRCL